MHDPLLTASLLSARRRHPTPADEDAFYAAHAGRRGAAPRLLPTLAAGAWVVAVVVVIALQAHS